MSIEKSDREQELEKALEGVIRNDRSMTYKYGESRPDGEHPEAGQRWLTPKEIAHDAL